MQTRHSTRQQVIERHLHHFVRQFEGMGARITLLAQALDVPLGTASELQAALQCDAATAGRPGREERMREELRGLLVLRYDAVARLADESGAQAARDILRVVHERLLAKGYPPLNLDG